MNGLRVIYAIIGIAEVVPHHLRVPINLVRDKVIIGISKIEKVVGSLLLVIMITQN